MKSSNNLFDDASTILDIPKSEIKVISIIIKGNYGDITYNINQNEQKMESDNIIKNLEKTNEELRNEINNLKKYINTLEKKVENGIFSIKEKYEDNYKQYNQLNDKLDKIIDENKKNDVKQKEINDPKEKHKLVIDYESKIEDNKILLKNSEKININSSQETSKTIKNQKKNHNQINNKNEQKKELQQNFNCSSFETEKKDNIIKNIPEHSNDQEKKLTEPKKPQINNRKQIRTRGFSKENKIGELEKKGKEKEVEVGINLSEKRKNEIAEEIIENYQLGDEYPIKKVIKKIDELNTKDILDEDDLIDTVGNTLSK